MPTIRPPQPRRRRVDASMQLVIHEWLREGDSFTVTVQELDKGLPGEHTPLKAVHVVGIVIDEVEDA